MTRILLFEIYASVFDSPEDISLARFSSSPDLLQDVSQERGVKRLQWFTQGLYSVTKHEYKVLLSDLRMGAQC